MSSSRRPVRGIGGSRGVGEGVGVGVGIGKGVVGLT